jgi:hypothetical protein
MDRLVITLVLLLWCVSVACAAVSKETAPTDQFADSVSSLSITGYTVTCAGGNPLITASVMSEFSNQTVTGVTYNSLTVAERTALTVPVDLGTVQTYFRVGTTGSAQTLTASFSSGDWVGHMGAQAFCGVDQVTPLGTSVTDSASGSTGLSVSVTVPANGYAMGAAFIKDESLTLDPQSGATEEWESSGGAACCSSAAGTTRTTTGDCGVTWDGSSRPAGLICMPINAAAVSAARRRIRNTLP